MSEITPLLFVYGTLLSGDTGKGGRAQRARLALEARVLGAAVVRGRLYHLGRYPGLVLAQGESALVHGELLELPTPEKTFAWLDAYEGIVPGQHPHNEYERQIVDVTTGGDVIAAWSYVYVQPTTGMRMIESGRWLSIG